MSTIYLDNAASTQDISSTYPDIDDTWDGNPHSIHQLGMNAEETLSKAEETLKVFINGHDGEFFWTGSGSQANSLAINTVCESSTLLTSVIEHKSILQHTQCFAYDVLNPTTWGYISSWGVESALSDITDLVSIQLVNNETGIINPIKMIAKLAHEHSTYMHTDAVQAFGKYKIDVEDLGVDLLTISAHKVHGPKGLGGLWVRNKVLNDEERGRFLYLGTPPVELVDRLASVLVSIDIVKNTQHIQQLEDTFLSTLIKEKIEYQSTVSPKHRIPGLISLRIPDVNADDLVFELSKQGIYISSGSACDNGKVGPSHVLTAMGVPKKQAEETVRISFSHLNTIEEVQEAAHIMAETIERIKNGSKSQ